MVCVALFKGEFAPSNGKIRRKGEATTLHRRVMISQLTVKAFRSFDFFIFLVFFLISSRALQFLQREFTASLFDI